MSNPYQSPQFAGQLPAGFNPGVDREKLRRVAKYQQWVLYAVLVNIIIYVTALVAQGMGFRGLGGLIALMLIPVALFAMVAIFLVANELTHVVVAGLCTLLMIVPCISLITLLVVNQMATSYLQQRGVKVGFMGANPNQI